MNSVIHCALLQIASSSAPSSLGARSIRTAVARAAPGALSLSADGVAEFTACALQSRDDDRTTTTADTTREKRMDNPLEADALFIDRITYEMVSLVSLGDLAERP